MIPIIFIVAGVILRVASILTLGIGSFTLGLPAPRRLVTTGLYSVARHPAYIGSALILVGVALLIGWWGLLAVPYLVLLVWRRHIEERKLLLKFPEYALYMSRVGFPRRVL